MGEGGRWLEWCDGVSEANWDFWICLERRWGRGKENESQHPGLGTDDKMREQGSGSLRSGQMVAIAWEVRYVSCRVSLHEYSESLETRYDRPDLEFHGRFEKL